MIMTMRAMGEKIDLIQFKIHVKGEFNDSLSVKWELGQIGPDLEKEHFFVNSEILGIQIWRKEKKKRVNYDKFEVATKQRKSSI